MNRKRKSREAAFEKVATRFLEGSGCLGNRTRAKIEETKIFKELEKNPERSGQFLEIADRIAKISPHAERALGLIRGMPETKTKIEKRRNGRRSKK